MADQPRPRGVKETLSVAKKNMPERKREYNVARALALINLIRKLKREKCKSEEEEKGRSEKNTKNKKDEPRLKIGKGEDKKELEDKEKKGKKRKKEDEEPEALVESKAELELLRDEIAVEPSIRIQGYHDCLHELVRQLKSKGFSGTVQVDLVGFSDAATAFNSCVEMGLTDITTTVTGIVPSPNPVLPPPTPAPQPPPSLEIPTPVDLDYSLEHDPDNSWRRRKD